MAELGSCSSLDTTSENHYQFLGTWRTSSGKNVNYILLKDTVETDLDVSRVYFNLQDIRNCENSSVVEKECSENLYISLVNLIMEQPTSEIVCELFRDFFVGLQPLASVLVTQQVSRNRLIESKVPKIQLNFGKLNIDSEGEENDDEVWNRESDEENNFDSRKKFKSEEERFTLICQELGQTTTLENHYSLVKTDSGNNVASCCWCSLKFFSSESSRRKVETQIVDHIILEHFKTDPYKHSRRQAAKSNYQCNRCQLNFGTKKAFINHRKTEKCGNAKTSFKCKKCTRTFPTKKLRNLHVTESHPSVDAKIAEKPALVCQTCGEKKNSEYNLSQHIKKFHENAYPEPIVCSLCSGMRQLRNRKYHTPYSYELHMRQIHSGGSEGKVVCEYCCKEFIGSLGKIKFALKEHIQGVHMGIRKSCDECGKTFISNIVLNKHKRNVHRKVGAYPCQACGKIFKYSQQAIDHEYKDRGLTPYHCKLCNFKTADNWALAKHKKVCPAGAAANVVVDVLPPVNLAL